MHFACRSFIGKHSDFNWSQYWENEPDEVNLVSQKGHLFGLINFSLDSGSSEINKIGKDIIAKVNSHYFSQSFDIISSLKDTLKYFQTELSLNFIQSTVVLSVVHGSQAYFASYNTGHVIIQRQDKISQLIYGQENEIVAISGPVLAADKILFSTDDFYQNIGFNKIKQYLADSSLQAIEEGFLSQLYTLNNQPNLAGALVEIHFDDNDEIIVPSQSSEPLISSPSLEPILTPPILSSSKISFFKKIFSKNDTYVSHREVAPITKRKRLNFIIGIGLIVGLTVLIYFGYQSNVTRKNEVEYQRLKTEINKKISDSIAIKNINLNSALDSAKSANSLLDDILKLKLHPDETEQLKKQIDSLLTQAGEAPTASTHDIVVDLTSVFSDSKFDRILFSNNEIVLVDKTAGSIRTFAPSTQKNGNIAVSSQIKAATSFTENNGTLYYVSDNQLYMIKQGESSLKIDFTKLSHNIDDISFWNGILYALDSAQSKIYKFAPSGSNFDNGSSWLKEGNTLDTNTVSLSINSSIWLLSSTGKISSFTRGVKDKIIFSEVNLPTSGVKIVTSVSTGTVIIYDTSNYIYLYKPTGELISKYNFSDKKISDVAINEKDSLIYILCDDQKIYKVSL